MTGRIAPLPLETTHPYGMKKLTGWHWSRYLDGVKHVTPYAAAARCTDYTKLPPTITYVGSIEPFRDETKIYVENLRRANVPVEFEVFDGAFHGFDVMVPDAPISKRANQFLMENFQKFAR